MKKPIFSLSTKKGISDSIYEQMFVEIYPIWILFGILLGLFFIRIHCGASVLIEINHNNVGVNNGCFNKQCSEQKERPNLIYNDKQTY